MLYVKGRKKVKGVVKTMGMAANQARLMTLTVRQSDLELRAQQISALKMRLAMQQQIVATNYSNALNGAYGAQQYTTQQMADDAIISMVTKNSYVLKKGDTVNKTFTEDQIMDLIGQGYKVCRENTSSYTNPASLTDAQRKTALLQLFKNNADLAANVSGVAQQDGKYYLTIKPNAKVVSTGEILFNVGERSAANTIEAAQLNNWFMNNISSVGSFTESELANALGITLGSGQTVTETTYTEISILERVAVESEASKDLDKAIEEYDSAMASLASQEKMYDLELTQINTEHKAVTTEYDSVKSLISDNVEKSFNIFG